MTAVLINTDQKLYSPLKKLSAMEMIKLITVPLLLITELYPTGGFVLSIVFVEVKY